MERWIAHVDMDAFFVAVELLRRPELRGRPVIVATGTDPTERGVVMTASYEARRFGVHSAMPLSVARRKCPDAVLLPRDMSLYSSASSEVMEIIRRHFETVEVAGLDEAYADLSGELLPKSACRRIKHEIQVATGLVCSIGLAPNKLLAKIASDLDKPDGLCVLRREQMIERVGDRPASLIPGVGPKTAERLRAAGVGTVAELAGARQEVLERALGARLAGMLRDKANGIDDRPVETGRERKSESCETTFARDVSDTDTLVETLDRLAARVCERLAEHGSSGRTVTVKIRLRPFRTFTRSLTLDAPTRDPQKIRAKARELLGRVELDAPVRLIGVGLSGLQADTAAKDDDTAGHGKLFTATQAPADEGAETR